MKQATTRRQLLDELEATRSRHLDKHDKACNKRDALYHQGILSIITFSLAAVKRRKLRSIVFGWHRFSGSRELRRELEAKEAKANQQRAWCVGHGYWILAQEHAGEAAACRALVRMMGG